MSKNCTWGLVFCILSAAIVGAFVIQPTKATTWFVTPPATIQAAINGAAADDTIMVGSGTYDESLTIDKPLKIVGAGASTTIIDGSNVALTSWGLVKFTANWGNTRFEGFTVRNAPAASSGGDRLCIFTKSNLAGAKYTIANCSIYGTNNPDDYQDWGFYASGGKEDILFTDNTVTQTGCNNIVLEKHTGATEISYNALDAGCWGTDAIFFMTYGSSDVTTLQNVSYNVFDMGTGGPFDYDHRSSGVSFSTPAPILGSGNAKFTNMVISGNTFNNLESHRRGVGFWNAGNVSNLIGALVTGNTINGVAGSVGSYGIDFYGLVDNTTLTYNSISNTSTAILLRNGPSALLYGAPGTRIYYNNIEDNGMGVNWTLGETTGQADTRHNWWGDGSGPYNPELNPEGEGQAVSDYVMIEPWLIAPYPPADDVEAILHTDPSLIEYWTVASGNDFTLDIKASNVTKLHGCEFKLYWNASLLDLTKVQVTSPWTTYFIGKNETDEMMGRYWLAMASTGTSTFNGSTTLVKLTFRITFDPIYPDNQTCQMELRDTLLSAPEGVPIYHMTHSSIYFIYSTKPTIFALPNISTAHALGYTFAVDIMISEAVDVYNFSFILAYNTTLLDATNLEVGSFLNSPLHIQKQIIDDENGLIWLWVWSESPALPATGNGTLGRITFKVTTATLWRQSDPHMLSCSLDIQDTSLVTSTGREIMHNVNDGTYRYEPKTGDLNYDGRVSLMDLSIIAFYYDPSYNAIADLNEDGKVNLWDLDIVATHYGEDC